MWFTGVEVEHEPSAPPPKKKILDPPLTTRPLPRQLFLDYSPLFLRQLGTSSQWLITWKGGSCTDIFHILYYNWGKEHHSLNPVNPLSPSINIPLIKDQSIFPLVIILLILVTFFC